MENPTSRNEWIIGKCRTSEDIIDKEDLKRQTFFNLLSKTTKMFKYENLPDTISEKDLETILQLNGFAIWKNVDGKLYVFFGSLGGTPNPYYLPTLAIVANPALKYDASLKIDEECVVMLNDSYYQGLTPLLNKYTDLLTEGEVTLLYSLLNARVSNVLNADNDNTAESAREYLNEIYKGKKFGIVATNAFSLTSEGLKSTPFSNNSQITQIIEAIQYIRGTMYNELGLRSSYNMKREALSEHEIGANDDILFPLVDDMLKMREIGIEKVNKMFGTNISVSLNSSWEVISTEQDLQLKQAQNEAEPKAQGGDNDEQNDSVRNTDNEQSD